MEEVDLLQVNVMQHLINLPKSNVYRKGDLVGELELARHIQDTLSLNEGLESTLVIPMQTGNEVFGFCIKRQR